MIDLLLENEDGEEVLAVVGGKYLSTEVAGRFTGRTVGFEVLSGSSGCRASSTEAWTDRAADDGFP